MINNDGDRTVLTALAAHGSDLTKPAHIVHYLYFKSREAADAAAETLRVARFQNVRVQPAAPTSLWRRLFGPREFSCIAEMRAVPSEAHVFATTDRMNALAAHLGGEYDGWEASVEA